jgi:ethanolamine ammonia-lyase small subunit
MTDGMVKRAPTDLRELTAARVSLPMSGHSLVTEEVLKFQLAHARARDAVRTPLHLTSFGRRLREELPVLEERGIGVLQLRSRAADRATYLRHPQLGRALDAESEALLEPAECDLAITIADGLSALAVERNAIPLLKELLPRLLAAGWTLAPLTVVQQGRVGVCDAIGEGLGAQCSLMLIGNGRDFLPRTAWVRI